MTSLMDIARKAFQLLEIDRVSHDYAVDLIMKDGHSKYTVLQSINLMNRMKAQWHVARSRAKKVA